MISSAIDCLRQRPTLAAAIAGAAVAIVAVLCWRGPGRTDVPPPAPLNRAATVPLNNFPAGLPLEESANADVSKRIDPCDNPPSHENAADRMVADIAGAGTELGKLSSAMAAAPLSTLPRNGA